MKPLKSKSCDEVIRMLKDCLSDANKLLKTTGVHPNYIATDEEEAFKRITYNEFKIQRIICQGKYGAAVAESYIREFKKRLSTYFTQRKNHKWIDVYADILDAYNHRKHSVTNRVPIELYTCETESMESDEPHLTANDKIQKFQEEILYVSSMINHCLNFRKNTTTFLFKRTISCTESIDRSQTSCIQSEKIDQEKSTNGSAKC